MRGYSTRFTRFFISSLLLAACVFLRSPSSREDCSLAKVYTFARLRMSVLIKLFSGLTRCTLSGYAAFAILTGCGVGALQSSYIPARSATQLESRPMRSNASAGYVYVSNRTQQGTSELLVYPAAAQNPSPLRIVTKKLVDATGIAVDLSGDVYVANGSGGNVVEFAPGGTSVVQTYSQGLVHPTAVTVANGTLYVADQPGQVVEYAVGNAKPLIGIAGPGYSSQPDEGIAVDPSGSQLFASASSLTAIPFAGGCAGSTYTVAVNLLPTLWEYVPLSNNQQAWGLAFDASGKLYVSDPCANDVAIYSAVDNSWVYSGKVTGAFEAPLFLTINNQFLAIPSGAGTLAGSASKVTVIDLTKHLPAATITNGLYYPVGAAVASGS